MKKYFASLAILAAFTAALAYYDATHRVHRTRSVTPVEQEIDLDSLLDAGIDLDSLQEIIDEYRIV